MFMNTIVVLDKMNLKNTQMRVFSGDLWPVFPHHRYDKKEEKVSI